MQYSLITTLFNEADNILNFLESYRHQTAYADEFIIVDGGSTDKTVEIIEKFSQENSQLNIIVIVDKTCSKKYVVGPVAKGRNVAIDSSKYNYIVATDAGCILDQNWFEEIIKPFEDESVDVVSGWYKANITNNFQQKFSDIMMPRLETVDRENFSPSSRSIAFKKNCWSSVGGYPTMTLTAEDTKFNLDLKKAGCKFQFTEKAFVYWDVPFDIKEAREKLFNYGFGDGQLRQRLVPKLFKMLFLLFPIHLLVNSDKRKHIWLGYNMLLFNSLGFLKGLLHPAKENNGK